ncbi:MAG: translation initiation factor IF-2 [Acidobacteriota bacterium]
MGKIRVQDLARMMSISNQDLVFKMKSIGVRVEGDDAHIDSETLQAIIQGKKLPHPREVILRDEPAATDAQRKRVQAPAPAPSTLRPQANPLRPGRPRTLIQKVEPRIQTLPASERPERALAEAHEASEALEAQAVAESVEPRIEARETPEAPAMETSLPPIPATPASSKPEAPSETSAPAAPAAPSNAPTPTQVPTAAPSTSPTPAAPSSTPSSAPYSRPPASSPGAPYRPPTGPGQGRPSGPYPPQRPQSSPGGQRPPMSQRPYPGSSQSAPGSAPGSSMSQRPIAPRPVSPRPPHMPSGRPAGPSTSAPYPSQRPRPAGPGTGTGTSDPRSRPPFGGGAGGTGTRPPAPSSDRPMIGRSDRPSGGGGGGGGDRDKRGGINKKPKKGAPARPLAPQADLTVFKGSLRGLDVDEDVANPSARRRRRAQLRESDGQGGGDRGKLLSFKGAPPSGPVTIAEGMTLREFADKLGVKVKDLIKALFDRGIIANINFVVEPHLAQSLASSLGVETTVVSFEQEVQMKAEMKRVEGDPNGTTGAGGATDPRGPVVTIMGHVDHGKTSLLDAIRSSKVAEGESGGITQHIGAYHVDVRDRKIVFLDTPGHEAFTMMRARGAKVTDIVVLVVAADDGVMPQTLEAIDHARAAKVPIVVAINKIDKPNANPDRVKRELADRGLQPEEWGGDTVMVGVSALKREGIDSLLEMILLTSDLLELRASPAMRAQGAVLEARKEVGRGIIATVLIQNGTLKPGDLYVTGATWGRVRSMTDDRGARIQIAGPSTPVEVSGFTDLPNAGDLFQVVEDEVKARSIAEYRQQEERSKGLNPVQRALSLEQLFGRIQAGDVKDLAVVLKADVQGSLEVLRDTLVKASTEKVKVQVILSGLGAITTNDVLLAAASKAIIIGFNVRPERTAVDLADKEGVDIRLHTVIYELLDELKKAMVGLLDPTYREVSAGRAEVRDTFKVPKIGTIAGCHVLEGAIPRGASIRLVRDGRVIFEGKINSLRRFKDDVSEVRAGFDCGIGIERFQDLKPGDIIEAYGREEVAATL